jgi:hypothetical protein
LTEAEFGVGPINPIETDKAYVFQLQPGAMFYDRCGRATTFQPSVDDNTQVHFTTNPFKFNKANIATGETASAVKKLQLQYSNVVDLGDTARQPITTLAPAEFSITPAPFMPNATAGMPPVQITDPTKFLIASPDGNGAIMLRGYYQMDTQYTFTVKAGATVDDFYRKVHDTAAEDLVVTWKTQPAIVVSSISPLDTATVKKSSATSVSNILLTFNQAMVPTSLDANDFTITPAVAGLTFGKGTSSTSSTSTRDCTDVHNACRLRISGVFPAGAYTFTLKTGATFTDVFGNTYTQAADKVVHFTVVDAPPPVIKCL